jgi:hypothetical protein
VTPVIGVGGSVNDGVSPTHGAGKGIGTTDLISLEHSVDPAYRSAARYMLCVANCNFVIYRSCNNVTSARCMLFIVRALLILAEQCTPHGKRAGNTRYTAAFAELARYTAHIRQNGNETVRVLSQYQSRAARPQRVSSGTRVELFRRIAEHDDQNRKFPTGRLASVCGT